VPATSDDNQMMMCVDSEDEMQEDESGMTEADENLYEIRFEPPYHHQGEDHKDVVVQEIE
jgi:hypothetical protein